MSRFWFDFLGVPHHVLSANLADMGPAFAARPEVFGGRSLLVQKLDVVPVECVVRGYLAGSGWKEYRAGGTVCGVALPPGLREADRLPTPIFTPATKATTGHDENISFAEMVQRVGAAPAERLRDASMAAYAKAAAYAEAKGVILADTKFEWGLDADGTPRLADEVFTPDSSRFWPADQYRPGGSPPSYDKQFVRDWLESVGYDKQSPPPPLPPEVVARTREKYLEGLERLTGRTLEQHLAATA
jgi:phosphoribosylaminoimidazole-succinocarboxamide synthase